MSLCKHCVHLCVCIWCVSLCVCPLCICVYICGMCLCTNTVIYYFSSQKWDYTVLFCLFYTACHKQYIQPNCQTTLRDIKLERFIALGPTHHYEWCWEKLKSSFIFPKESVPQRKGLFIPNLFFFFFSCSRPRTYEHIAGQCGHLEGKEANLSVMDSILLALSPNRLIQCLSHEDRFPLASFFPLTSLPQYTHKQEPKIITQNLVSLNFEWVSFLWLP